MGSQTMMRSCWELHRPLPMSHAGKAAYAHAIDTNGNKSVIQFHFTNVRCVPSFKYTLLSVDQIWEEQHITARFQDDRHLQLPASAGGFTIPYTPNRKLFTLSLISAVPRRAAPSWAVSANFMRRHPG